MKNYKLNVNKPSGNTIVMVITDTLSDAIYLACQVENCKPKQVSLMTITPINN